MMPCCWARTLPLVLAAVAKPASALTRDEIVDGVQALTVYSQQWPMLWPVVLAAMAVLFMLFAVRGWRALLPHMSGFDHLLWGLLTLGGALPALGVVLGQGRVVLDVAGDERRGLTVPDLVAMFARVRGEEVDDDALLLG